MPHEEKQLKSAFKVGGRNASLSGYASQQNNVSMSMQNRRHPTHGTPIVNKTTDFTKIAG